MNLPFILITVIDYLVKCYEFESCLIFMILSICSSFINLVFFDVVGLFISWLTTFYI